MKRKIWISHLIAFALALLLSAGVVGCLITAFELQVQSTGVLMLQCVLFSAGCALCFRFRGGNLLVVCLMAVAAGFLWRTGAWYEHLQSLLMWISDHYRRAYGWDMLFTDASLGPVDYPLVTIAWLVSISVSWTVSRRKHAIFALPPVLLPLIACFVVDDTVPAAGYLYLVMLGTALLLLTDFSRRKGILQGNRMMAMAAVPVAAALAVLFLAVPQKNYVNRFEEIQDRILLWVEKFQSLAQESAEHLSIGADGSSLERLNLSTVGPKTQWDYTVMEVTSPIDGTLYLRGRDYNTYGGKGWVASRHRVETFSQGGETLGPVTIRTYNTRDILYIPYYPAGEITLAGGAAGNTENVQTYSFELAASPQAGALSATPLIYSELLSSAEAPDTLYRQLPAATMAWANSLARELTQDCTTIEAMAQAIGDYVQSSASYDLNTRRMDSNADDFARWFLEESETGYCVHFATAATVLLRAVNIPARYVEGYLVSCRAGETVDVSSTQAHAWAEYYDSDLGAWVPLEATPADESEPEPTESAVPTEASTEPVATAPGVTAPPDSPETQSPVQTGPASTENAGQPHTEFRFPGWAKALLALALVLLVIWGQSEVRICRKQRLWRSDRPNARALARYSQLCQLARLTNQEMPEQIGDLAQKARFSQHTLTKEELDVFDACRQDLETVLKKRPRYQKLMLRLVFAIKS